MNRSAGKRPPEPDAHLMIQNGVAYRYLLSFGEPELIAGILRILKEVSISMEYLLLFPGKSGKTCKAYLGLASSDVGDLPFRFAAIGIGIHRGEEVGEVNH
jgi:hypothetical protein